MNEPANFGTNEERPWNWPEKDRPYWSLKCPTGNYDDPPYRTSQFSSVQLQNLCFTESYNKNYDSSCADA